MTLANKLLMCGGGVTDGGDTVYIDDVFSTFLYTGSGAALDIENGIDLAGEGGMVWVKNRDQADTHVITDTERGVGKTITSETTATEVTNADTTTDFNADGFSIGVDVLVNTSTEKYASWTFRKSPRFFDVQTVTKTSGSNVFIGFSALSTIGMVIVKRTDSTGSWYVWHRSLTDGKLLYLEQSVAASTLGHIIVSGTNLTLKDGIIADGDYVIYCFAHDPLGPSGDGSDGLIACGSYAGANTDISIDLGWEPQYILIKCSTNSERWIIIDTIRGAIVGGVDPELWPNKSVSEGEYANLLELNATGFTLKGNVGRTNYSDRSYIYMAIRRSNKPPDNADDVFAIDKGDYSGSTTDTEFYAGFPIDMAIYAAITSYNDTDISARLLNKTYLETSTHDSETTDAAYNFNSMDEWFFAARSSTNYSWMWKRAPGFFDVVCYTGTGITHTESHNLGVEPEMMLIKNRDETDDWAVYVGDETEYLVLNTDAAVVDLNTYWNDTAPTSSVFTVGTVGSVNFSTERYVAYLFATLPGISKVGSYTGNGGSQTIDCGFSAGARFILIKRTDSTGDWFIWDTERGIVTGDDPHLSLNTIEIEVTTDDSIDPVNSGFIANQVAATDINVTSATYIYYAIA